MISVYQFSQQLKRSSNQFLDISIEYFIEELLTFSTNQKLHNESKNCD